MAEDEKSSSKNSNKMTILITVIATLLIAGGGGFFAGIKYEQTKVPSFARRFTTNGQSGGQNAQFFQRGDVNRNGINVVRGEISSNDNGTLTVKLPDNSSKIIILSDSTQINKAETGSKDDLTQGTQVVVTGQTNSDGSVTAQNIQVGDFGFFNRPDQSPQPNQ
jgi:hypothetical protein